MNLFINSRRDPRPNSDEGGLGTMGTVACAALALGLGVAADNFRIHSTDDPSVQYTNAACSISGAVVSKLSVQCAKPGTFDFSIAATGLFTGPAAISGLHRVVVPPSASPDSPHTVEFVIPGSFHITGFNVQRVN